MPPPRGPSPPRALDIVRRWAYNGPMATKTARLSVRLGPKLREDAEAMAYRLEMTLGEFIRYALSEYIKEQTDESD